MMWADIEGYEGFYQVNRSGSVRSLPRRVNSGKRTITVPGRILAGAYDGNGYIIVSLSKEGVHKTIRIHRLVATAFIKNPYGKNEVNHINGKKDDNRVENLEWNSREENVAHEFMTGLGKTAHLKHEPREVTMRNPKSGTLSSFSSILVASTITGIDPTSICKCCQGKRKTAGTFEWEYGNGGTNNANFANC